MAAGGLRWYVQVTILWAVKTKPCRLFIPLRQEYYLAQLAGREASGPFYFSQVYVGSHFHWYTPEYVLESTAVGNAP